jgi:pyrroline-5-carboxylate reductase
MDTLAILGGGKIGEALLSGLLRGERTPADIVLVERFSTRAKCLSDTYGVKALDVADAAAVARTLVVAVKPQDIDALLDEVAPVLGPDHLVVSVAAGITTAKIEAA